MDDLVPQILAAIEATETDARQACGRKPGGDAWTIAEVPPGRWGQDEQDTEVIIDGKPVVRCDYEYGGVLFAEHIARHDPASVLRRCAADRKLLELHAQVPTHEGSTETGCKLCLWEYSWGCDVQAGICDTVSILAEGYGVAPAVEPAQS